MCNVSENNKNRYGVPIKGNRKLYKSYSLIILFIKYFIVDELFYK